MASPMEDALKAIEQFNESISARLEALRSGDGNSELMIFAMVQEIIAMLRRYGATRIEAEIVLNIALQVWPVLDLPFMRLNQNKKQQ